MYRLEPKELSIIENIKAKISTADEKNDKERQVHYRLSLAYFIVDLIMRDNWDNPDLSNLLASAAAAIEIADALEWQP